MSLSIRHLQQPAGAPTHGMRSLAAWRFWTALVTIVAFVLLLSNISTHHHATSAEDQDCAVCSVVSHKITDLPEVVLPKLVLVIVSFASLLVLRARVARPSVSLLPPSCGPPAGA
jgi:heme/copper-type cytochrome/quinol oxidase subunit 2